MDVDTGVSVETTGSGADEEDGEGQIKRGSPPHRPWLWPLVAIVSAGMCLLSTPFNNM